MIIFHAAVSESFGNPFLGCIKGTEKEFTLGNIL
jgi:hypothetical protein